MSRRRARRQFKTPVQHAPPDHLLSLPESLGDDVPGSGAPWGFADNAPASDSESVSPPQAASEAARTRGPNDCGKNRVGRRVGRYSDSDRRAFLVALDEVDEHQESFSDSKIAAVLERRIGKQISVSTISRWRREYMKRLNMRAAGELSSEEPHLKPQQPRSGRPSVLDAQDEEILAEYVMRYGKRGSTADAREYLYAKRYKPLELSDSIEPWHVSLATICNHLKKQNRDSGIDSEYVSLRPRRHDSFGPQTQEACLNYITFLEALDEEHLLFSSNKHALLSADESWMTTQATRHKGWVVQGQARSVAPAPRSSISFFAALAYSGEIVFLRTNIGNSTGESSQRYLEGTISAWRKKYGSGLLVVTWDNVPHHYKALSLMSGSHGVEHTKKVFVRASSTIPETDERYSPLIYYELDRELYGGPVLVVPTPKYQPDFAPIETVFGSVKYAAEGIRARSSSFGYTRLSERLEKILNVVFGSYLRKDMLKGAIRDTHRYMKAWQDGAVNEDEARARRDQLRIRDKQDYDQIRAATGGILRHRRESFELAPIMDMAVDNSRTRRQTARAVAASQEDDANVNDFKSTCENKRLLLQRDKAQARARRAASAALRSSN
ncbi:uncharacterized protein MONBRDRAFT_9093 [Monosiga brevicollis MX1]|uniref:Uncharacterized protein n=2 Tax=Monosiga brevicollis TaxID=81824 RepID=A9UXG1_MONBE|nr:uncharacterized protein MONBRDRAFT_7800 [Monosiga brevicollis MX1]XP_001746772.1 uncharacterized protein MONBRDRAFT_9093 [Monosiga brevicollis MX1]EDQ88668.1 predicted protein [Monosiga brevicollis MX1]EDQ89839.1 predicted protein [Monosiga brevicollis MX1]|eukprot:XP_001745261.1 hypothetical protein [Monosiga brevicollis MX1]